jgi:hypothetical protein
LSAAKNMLEVIWLLQALPLLRPALKLVLVLTNALMSREYLPLSPNNEHNTDCL